MASAINNAPRPREHLNARGPRIVISVDYGTTYTGAAWAVVTNQPPKLEDIRVVMDWPDGQDPKVPSLYTYNEQADRRWGFGISNDPYVIQKTKMRLQQQKRLKTMEILKHFLNEVESLPDEAEPPIHLLKSPPDTLLDYLIEVARRVRRHIESDRDVEVLERASIDLIITHPGEWDSRAKNATFRAATKAFMRAMPEYQDRVWSFRLATEPEACAHYTMQVATEGLDNLIPGDCFVVVDAGGGTVDLLSYEVKSKSPTFQVQQATKVSSASCGATYIDDFFFREYLPNKLGTENYEGLKQFELESNGGRPSRMRPGEQLMAEEFQRIKHNFTGGQNQEGEALPDVIPLPAVVVENDPDRDIENGQLFISRQEMELIFQESVDRTLSLIRQQLAQIAGKGLHVQTIFLSGGFSRSKYLLSRVKQLAAGKNCQVVRAEGKDGQGSWTAVAQGAVIMGLQLGCLAPEACARCPVNIGVMLSEKFAEYKHEAGQKFKDSFDGESRAKGNVKWVVEAGDLIPDGDPISRQVNLVTKMSAAGHKPGCVNIVIFRDGVAGGPPHYLSEHNLPPTARLVKLDYDFSKIPVEVSPTLWQKVQYGGGRRGYYFQLEMQLRMKVYRQLMRLEVIGGSRSAVGSSAQLLGHYRLGFREESLV